MRDNGVLKQSLELLKQRTYERKTVETFQQEGSAYRKAPLALENEDVKGRMRDLGAVSVAIPSAPAHPRNVP